MQVNVELPAEQKIKFKKLLRKSGRREIGGLLMGEQCSPNNFKVVGFTVDDKIGSEAHFCRKPSEHVDELEKFFFDTNCDYARYNYLGEWHSHPSFSTNPSPQDILEMKRLVKAEATINFAVLLIVRLRWFVKLEVSASIYSRSTSQKINVF